MARILVNFKKLVKNYIKKKVKNYKVIQNINLDVTQNQKKILFIYLNQTLYQNISKNLAHTNYLESSIMIKVLIENNFCIDILKVNDMLSIQPIKNKKYDYILGFGDNFYEMGKFNMEAKKILYLTENPPEISLKKELERLKYFQQRKGIKSSLTRSGQFYKEKHFTNIDYCITLGEEKFHEYKHYKTYRMLPTGLYNENFNIKNIKNTRGKPNYLWFGSNGAIHKGLDILLDVFKDRGDINLYIAGLNKKDEKILKIPRRNNIQNLGFLKVNSYEFIDTINKCDYVILPSCSEATSTSVLTCMRHGVIPIVQNDIGFNHMRDEYVYILDEFSIEYINNFLNDLIKIDKNKILEKRLKIYEFANYKFTLGCFKKNFNNIINKIVSEASGNRKESKHDK
ncbi:glycosyltransferase [Clostridium magnum]|uniref:Glycosyl transferases group 1 n=1 Tax=Clostridium magnum DSM 2767 TaxID=1121326 RepID=A0A161WSG6_9CLOT|nr:glycosyltransferase [Clostridium magnum]KZL89728.1 glycosyl transferases group 1 [Clostridium magnum DSM 2767]SHH65086.1 Glycosyltransferase involved in cell wall bisynthesis [Clostridium magnum DSM 2767]